MREDISSQDLLDANQSENRSNLWWSTPPVGFSKLNLDGSFDPLMRVMGFGGVMRDSAGNWLWGFSDSCSSGNVLGAELLAIKFGRHHAWDRNHRKIYVETDSLEAVHLLTADITCYNSSISSVIMDIKAMMRRQWEVHLSHVLREANILADHLSKLSSRGDRSSRFWITPPLEVLDFTNSDSYL
ncbi:Ribonuclease H-like superfamily [Sesbania bispinosa]|nr:Ribonuclease H-like superfamily [Sesbania bispinosa]